MPQLDFANPLTTSQVVWLALIFAGLYFALDRWALPQVADTLQRRAAHIGADLDAARSSKTAADAAVAEQTAASRQAQAAAQAEIAEAVGRAREDAAQKAAAMDADLDRRLSESERQISEARGAAMAALRDVATATTGVLVGRLTGHAPDVVQVGRAVDAVMARRAG